MKLRVFKSSDESELKLQTTTGIIKIEEDFEAS